MKLLDHKHFLYIYINPVGNIFVYIIKKNIHKAFRLIHIPRLIYILNNHINWLQISQYISDISFLNIYHMKPISN